MLKNNGNGNCRNLLTGEFTDTEAVNPDYDIPMPYGRYKAERGKENAS